MSIALVTSGRLYPTASPSGEPIIIVRRDHFVAISSEIVDYSNVEVDMGLAEDINVTVSPDADISADIEVRENVTSDAVELDVISGDIEGCS